MDEIREEIEAERQNRRENCQGCGGWWLSDFDSWETCPKHFHGQPHPESEAAYMPPFPDEDRIPYYLKVFGETETETEQTEQIKGGTPDDVPF